MIAAVGRASPTAGETPTAHGRRARRRDHARHLLWSDLRPYRRRARTLEDAFAAIGVTLARNLPLGGDERDFLAARDAFDAIPASARARVWRDPQAYFWVRRAYQLIATVVGGAALPSFDADYVRAVGGSDARHALGRHLDAFTRFVLGANLVADRTCRLARPYVATLPVAFPGSTVALVGNGEVVIGGVARGRVLVDGARDTGVVAEPSPRRAMTARGARAPVVRVGPAAIVMQPAVFAWPAVPFGVDIAGVGPTYQRTHAPLLRRALELVRRFEPRTFRTLARAVGVVALKPRPFPDFANLSHSELPGAIICSRVADPYVLAASLVHEVHHHRLFLLEELAPLFDADRVDPFGDARYYSPWRDDPRPLQGILHAVYVYVAVLRFWRAVARHGVPRRLTGALVRDRLVRVPVQLRIGVAQLRRYARFTRYGARVCAALADDVARLASGPGTLDVPAIRVSLDDARLVREIRPDGTPATVRDALVAHLALGAGPGGCALADAAL